MPIFKAIFEVDVILEAKNEDAAWDEASDYLREETRESLLFSPMTVIAVKKPGDVDADWLDSLPHRPWDSEDDRTVREVLEAEAAEEAKKDRATLPMFPETT